MLGVGLIFISDVGMSYSSMLTARRNAKHFLGIRLHSWSKNCGGALSSVGLTSEVVQELVNVPVRSASRLLTGQGREPVGQSLADRSGVGN